MFNWPKWNCNQNKKLLIYTKNASEKTVREMTAFFSRGRWVSWRLFHGFRHEQAHLKGLLALSYPTHGHPNFMRLNIRGALSDVIMSAMVSQITSVSIVYFRLKETSKIRSLTFVWRIHRWPVNSPLKGPETRKMFIFDDVIMLDYILRMRRNSRVIWGGPFCKYEIT